MRILMLACALVAVAHGGPTVSSGDADSDVMKRDATTASVVKRQTCGEDSSVTGGEIDIALTAHNTYRSKESATDEFKLTYSDAMARRAQEWASKCQWEHGLTQDCDGNPIGQNMYIVAGGGGGFPALDADRAIKLWADEKANYHLDTKSCDAGKMCGHYTQVVWAKTQEVGCGVAQCETVSSGDNPSRFTNAVLYVCDYTPAGNYKNQSPFEQGEACAKCEQLIGGKSGYVCEENLCRPCTPQSEPDKCVCKNSQDKCQNGGTFNADTCTCDCTSDFFGDYCENKCECVDQAGYDYACSQWNNAGFCDSGPYRQYMTQTCPLTCGFCDLPPSCNA